MRLAALLDPLPFPARMRLLAERAHQFAADGTLAALAAGDREARRNAVFVAMVAGHRPTIEGVLRDADPVVRAAALGACARVGVPDEVVSGVLDDAPAELRRRVYAVIRSGRRTALAEALITPTFDRYGDREAAQLLSSCSEPVVRAWLPRIGHAIGSGVALTHRFPDAMLDEAERVLAALGDADRHEWWSRHCPRVLAANRSRPSRVLDLLERYLPPKWLPWRFAAFGALLTAEPVRTLAVLAAPGRQGIYRYLTLPRPVLRALGRLEPALLAGFATMLREHHPRLWVAVLASLPPSRRGELFAAAHDQDATAPTAPGGLPAPAPTAPDAPPAPPGDLTGGPTAPAPTAPGDLTTTTPTTLPHDAPPTDPATLAVLPRDTRIAEARRILALPRIREDRDATLRYSAHLSLADARPVLDPESRHPDPDRRAAAYEALIACAVRERDPAAFAGLLEGLTRLRNEQEPVRTRVLAAIATAPTDRFAPALPVLDRIVADALAARDAGHGTRGALGTVAARLLATEPAWAARTFDRLFESRSVPYLAPLDQALRRGQEHAFFAAVGPWLARGLDRGRPEPLFAVAGALGRRGWSVPALAELLRRAAHPDQPGRTQAVTLYLADPRARSARVEEVLRADTSSVTVPAVWRALCHRRQDLLDVVLDRAPEGRYLTPGARWVPSYPLAVERWLPRQRRAYADLLARVAADTGRPGDERVRALGAAARIPEYGLPVLAAHLDSPDTRLAEAALGGLVWTDRPADHLPLLLSRADTDQARVAVYAAARAVRSARPSTLPAALGPVLAAGAKVTSRKEAARLLGRDARSAGLPALLAAWEAERHRDVRHAVVGAVAGLLDDERAWRILDAALAEDPLVAAAVLAPAPWTLAERHRPRYAQLVLRAAGASDPVLRRAAWVVLPAWAGYLPDPGAAATVLVEHLADLDRRTDWPEAADALAALHRSGLAGPALLDATERLLALEHRVPVEDRDLPARRRLTGLATRLGDRPNPGTGRDATLAVAARLAAAPDWLPTAVDLVHGELRFAADPDTLAADLGELADLVRGRPVLAAGLTFDTASTAPPATLVDVARRLAARGDLAGGLFAVRLLVAGARDAWTAEACGVLAELRTRQEPDVRDAALGAATVGE
ncbi:hypothetical protein AB0M43_32670 [Longispora sp. NPDC051575]|uniref:hypothetical protein n=1 Tax=Longispora sp. NPDC051575 TaxID=3154943 RepID=UPI00342689D6